MELKGYLFSLLYGLVCLGLAFGLYKVGVPKKITRKIVHILVGAEWIILYHFVGTSIHFLVVCLAFLALLAVSHIKKLMPMISSDEDNAPGTVYYAVAMTVMSAICLFESEMMLPFGIGVFCTSLGDGLAGLVGQCVSAKWNFKVYGNKTVVGALVNLLSCLSVTLVFREIFDLPLTLLHCAFVTILALELELFTGKGLDNITITLGTSFLSYLLINLPGAENYIVPILLTPLIIALSYSKRALTVGGIVAAVVIDIMISLSLGNFGFCILLLFFAGGVIVDKIKKSHKNAGQNAKEPFEKRGECRDQVQVIANGSVATICAVAFLISGEKVFVVAFVSALAEAFADTAASGIGALRGKAYDLFRMRRCAPGISGGMSLLGTSASLAASIIVSAAALAFGRITLVETLIVILTAFLGAIFDSFLGSLLQVKYRCQRCGAIVEREEHCGKATVKHSGFKIITNDTVNFLGTLFSAVLCAIIYYIM